MSSRPSPSRQRYGSYSRHRIARCNSICHSTEGSLKRNKVQGEGDYESARRFNRAERQFVESGKVEEAARRAAPRNAKEASELKAAERAGRSRAKGLDPADTRNYRQPTKR
jgi:hypothetical protein